MKRLDFPERKQIRARVLADYIQRLSKYDGFVCVSCGNASKALDETGIFTIPVISPAHWYDTAELHNAFPQLLDATSGHLQLPVMKELSNAFGFYLGELPDDTYEVPTGSGETILCLKWAYPKSKFIAVYNVGKGTEYDERNPLNAIIEAEFEVRR